MRAARLRDRLSPPGLRGLRRGTVAREWCRPAGPGTGCATWLYSRVRPQVLDRLGDLGLLGGVTVHPTNRQAVEALSR